MPKRSCEEPSTVREDAENPRKKSFSSLWGLVLDCISIYFFEALFGKRLLDVFFAALVLQLKIEIHEMIAVEKVHRFHS